MSSGMAAWAALAQRAKQNSIQNRRQQMAMFSQGMGQFGQSMQQMAQQRQQAKEREDVLNVLSDEKAAPTTAAGAKAAESRRQQRAQTAILKERNQQASEALKWEKTQANVKEHQRQQKQVLDRENAERERAHDLRIERGRQGAKLFSTAADVARGKLGLLTPQEEAARALAKRRDAWAPNEAAKLKIKEQELALKAANAKITAAEAQSRIDKRMWEMGLQAHQSKIEAEARRQVEAMYELPPSNDWAAIFGAAEERNIRPETIKAAMDKAISEATKRWQEAGGTTAPADTPPPSEKPKEKSEAERLYEKYAPKDDQQGK